ncbi:unnamed protein product [Penicillium manginii]
MSHNTEELNIQTRAEPTRTAITKSARLSERILEDYFFLILSDAVKKQSRLKCIKYIASGEHCERVRLIHASHHYHRKMDNTSVVERESAESYEMVVFQVTTPTFYSKFFHYHSPFAALERELLDESNTRTAWSSHPREFIALFFHTTELVRQPKDWRWDLISLLRTPPSATNFPHLIAYETFGGISLADHWVQQHCSLHKIRKYQCTLLRLFLGNRIGGFSLGSFKGDFELIGLSRDAMLLVYEIFLKAGLASITLILANDKTSNCNGMVGVFFCMLGMASLNIWACLKAIF